MAQKMSIAEQQNRNNLAVAGAQTHKAKLPKEVGPIAGSLSKRNEKIKVINAKQENAKAVLVNLTKELNDELKLARAERARIVKAAEFAFGARAAELKEFRPASEGQG